MNLFPQDDVYVCTRPSYVFNTDTIVSRKCSSKNYSSEMWNVQLFQRLRTLDETSRMNINYLLTTGQVCDNLITDKNIYDHLELGRLLQNAQILSACEEALLENLDISNCLDMFQLATTYGLQQLCKDSKELIINSFQNVCCSEQLLTLGQNVLFDLIKEPEIRSHPSVEMAIENWYRYETEPRQHHRDSMLEYLRQYKKKCSSCEISVADKGVLTYHVMFIVDKATHCSCPCVSVLELSRGTQRQSPLPELNGIDSGFAVCCMQNNKDDPPHVFVSGGFRHPETVHHFDIVMNSRKKCSKKLKFGRSRHCMVSLGHAIYVLGGLNNGGNVTSIEEFVPKRHSWKVVGRLQRAVHSAACCVYDNVIYIFGGVFSNGEQSNLIQKFDPCSKVSTVVTNLPFSVSGAKSTLTNDKIYLVAKGRKDICFEPKSGTVTISKETNPLTTDRFALLSDRGSTYMIGRVIDNNNGEMEGLFKLSESTGIWEHARMKLKSPVSVCDSCIIRIPETYDNILPFSKY